MKFLCIFYIMFWQTTFSFGMNCSSCRDVESCSVGFVEKSCGSGFDICVTVIESHLRGTVVKQRSCVNQFHEDLFKQLTGDQYSNVGCKKVGRRQYYCSCTTNNCNDKMLSEIDLPIAVEPTLMCYHCKVTETPDCIRTSEELLVPCGEEIPGLQPGSNVTTIPFNVLLSNGGGDYYCTTEFVNDKTVSRDCKKKKDLPNPDAPNICSIDGSTMVCPCQTDMCNNWSSFSTANDAAAIKGFLTGILTCSIVYSLGK